MKDTLNIVRGAVAKRDLVPILTHMVFQDGYVRASNGFITVSTPCIAMKGQPPFAVPAGPFMKAVDVCGGEPRIKLTANGRVQVSRGSFRATLPVGDMDGVADTSIPVGINGEVGPEFLETVVKLRPFVGTDAHRMWSHGVLVKDGWMWATNNITLARAPVSKYLPPMQLPSPLLDELIRLGPPNYIYCGHQQVGFAYEDGTTVVGSLLNGDWPDVHQFFKEPWPELPEVDTKALLAAVQQVAPFCTDVPAVVLTESTISTGDGEMSASVEIGGLRPARLRLEPFVAVLGAADRLELTDKVHRWTGPGIEGVLVGMV